MSATVRVPAELRREFRQFRADFDAVWLCWIEAGEETEATYSQAKDDAARWISQCAAAPDAAERLSAMFGHWSELRSRVAPLPAGEVAVVPGLTIREVQAMRDRRAGQCR